MIFTKEKITTAIDISDGFVKIAAVLNRKNEKTLYALDSARLTVDEEKEVAKEVRSLILKNKLIKPTVLVSFPRHLVTIRNVQLPTTNEEEMRNMAELQAIKHLPYLPEEIAVSFKILDVTKEGYANILLILAQRKLVDRYVNIFKYAGIPIEKLALSSEGIFNRYLNLDLDDSRSVAMIDFDRYHTHVQIARERKLLFSRSIHFDTTSPSPDKDAFLREIRLSFDAYRKEKDEDVSRILLSGSENCVKGFSAFLSDNLELPCGAVGGLEKIPLKDTSGKFLEHFKETSFIHLLGIALQPEKLAVNLLPRDIVEKKKEDTARNELIKTALLLFCIIAVTFGIIEKKINEKRLYLKRIETQLEKIEPAVKRLSRLKENIELVQGQLTFKGSSISIIREVYEILPKGVSLTLFEFEDKNRLLLRGTTKELSGVFNLLPLLEKSPYLGNVKINYATKRTFKNTEFADFEIICTLDKD